MIKLFFCDTHKNVLKMFLTNLEKVYEIVSVLNAWCSKLVWISNNYRLHIYLITAYPCLFRCDFSQNRIRGNLYYCNYNYELPTWVLLCDLLILVKLSKLHNACSADAKYDARLKNL